MGKSRKPPTTEALLSGRKKGVKYTAEVAHDVLDRMARGETWSHICRQPNKPSLSALYTWKRRHPEFAEAVAIAREMAADTAADESVEVARETTPQTASASRVKVAALQWMASKAAPKRYGARPEAEAAPARRRLVIRVRHFEEYTDAEGRTRIREILPEAL